MASLSKLLSAERSSASAASKASAVGSDDLMHLMDEKSTNKLPEIPIVSNGTKLTDLPLLSAFDTATNPSPSSTMQQQQMLQTPKWMSPDELLAFRSIRVSVNEYAELVKKLDILYSSKGNFSH
jgi:hypothetical protein